MAKVTTGQKINRLPPGKIFGMTVTEPDTANKSREDAHVNQNYTATITEKIQAKEGTVDQKNMVNFIQMKLLVCLIE